MGEKTAAYDSVYKQIEAEGKPLVEAFRKAHAVEAITERNIAFLELVRLLTGPMTGHFMTVYGAMQNDALDLYQDYWEKLLEKLPDEKLYNLAKPLSPWLFIVARNIKYDGLRKVQKEREAGIIAKRLSEIAPDSCHSVSGRGMTEIEEAYSIRERIASLSEENRKLYSLYFDWDFSLKEVAKLLQLPESTVQGRIRRIRDHVSPKITHKGSLAKNSNDIYNTEATSII